MNLLEEFEEQFMLDLSKDTMVNYKSDIKQFLNYTSDKLGVSDHVEILNKLHWGICNKYRNKLSDDGLSKSSINRKLSAISSLLDMCVKIKLLEENYMTNVKRLSTKDVPLKNEFLSENEVELLCRAIENPPKGSRNVEFIKARDLFLYVLIITSGTRISETLNIKFEDINFEDKTINIVGKGDKFRLVPFDNYVEELYYSYIIERDKVLSNKGMEDIDYLFLSPNGKRLSARNSNDNLKKYCERANIKDISNHVLRHTFATIQVNRGKHINTIAKTLGHSNVKTTSRYMHTSDEKLRENIGVIRKG